MAKIKIEGMPASGYFSMHLFQRMGVTSGHSPVRTVKLSHVFHVPTVVRTNEMIASGRIRVGEKVTAETLAGLGLRGTGSLIESGGLEVVSGKVVRGQQRIVGQLRTLAEHPEWVRDFDRKQEQRRIENLQSMLDK